MESRAGSELLKLPSVAPAVMPSVTELLKAGFPDASFAVTVTVACPVILTVSGLTVRVTVAGVGGGGVPMVNTAVLLMVLAPTLIDAVNVTVATPKASVTALAAENTPVATPPETLKFTVTPARGLFEASLTNTRTSQAPPLPMEVIAGVVVPTAANETATLEGGLETVPTLMDPVFEIEPPEGIVAVAVTVTCWSVATAVRVTVATPEAFVVALAGKSVPFAAPPVTAKLTAMPDTAFPPMSLTVACTSAWPPLGMEVMAGVVVPTAVKVTLTLDGGAAPPGEMASPSTVDPQP